MPQIGGKNAKKSSSTSKRHFTVVIGTKEHGLYCSSSPSSAARKAVSKLCAKEKGKKVEFCLREITQGSKKKTYGPYLGHIEKLAKPIELKGRVIERKPVALLKPKSSTKKGGGKLMNKIRQLLGHRGTSGNRTEEEFTKEIAISFARNRPFTMPNKETRIQNQNKYKNIPEERLRELKSLGRKMGNMIQLEELHKHMEEENENNE